MILNTFTRKDSPNWYLQFSDPKTGRRRVMVTHVAKGEAGAELKLTKLRLDALAKYTQGFGRGADQEEHGWKWVQGWIAERYGNKGPSLVKHRNQWNYLLAFLHKHSIHGPMLLERVHAQEYIAWRRAKRKEKSKRCVGRNTALAELRWAGTVLREAVARNLIAKNPWEKLGFERDDTDERPELSDREIGLIREELRSRPDWMRVSFEIALHSGLRFAETRIRLTHIDLENRLMLIAKPKGGRGRAYSVPIPVALEGLLKSLDGKGNLCTWTVPNADLWQTGLLWSKLFKRLDLGVGYCFHCTRVTFISRGARAGIPEHVMRKLVNHSSSAVHRIYQRVTVQDVAAYVDRVKLPASPLSTPDSPGA